MATDLSRIRRNPLLDYSGVVIRQGAVALDSEKNLSEDLTNRRLVALAGDVLGRSSVSQNTPRAFEITPSNGGFSIGVGRYYVDGLLAENHGAPDAGDCKFDPVLGEPVFSAAIDYAAQPYLPVAPALPERGTHLVYLEVWQREVTPAQDADLVEIAVNVETSSRLQTVWQVKVLPNPRNLPLTCASELDDWAKLIAPSTGVLSTGTFEVPEADDPCELPPTGGYRGLENQLYRVEIHDPGLPGQGATFKFSRENASVESAVELVVHPKELTLKSLGRDDVLGFNLDDWIEISDEARELSRLPGELRKIINIDRDSRRIALNEDLPPDLAPPGETRPNRGLLVRRWDQKGTIRSVGPSATLVPFHELDVASPQARLGVIPVPAANTTLFLEDGVTVTFDDTGSAGFKQGDYWVFAARTADASIERLERAPPLGICHHFARLAVWDAGEGRVTDDCRGQWPPSGGQTQPAHDCSCTVCVTPEQHNGGHFTIQQAVGQVKRTGGTVCLTAGRYLVESTIEVRDAQSVRIRGVSRGRLATRQGTVLEADNEVFAIAASQGIELQDLVIDSKHVALRVESSANVVLERLAIDGVAQAVQLEGQVANLCIRENELRGKVGIRGEGITHGVDAPLPEARHEPAVTFEDNWIVYDEVGLQVTKVMASGHTRIVRNQLQGVGKAIEIVHSSEGPKASTTLSDNDVEVSGERAIESNAKTLVATGNQVLVTGQGGPALLVEAEECSLERNRLEVRGPLPALQVRGRVATVEANRVKCPRDSVAIDLGSVSHATILANVTAGEITPPASPRPAATWKDFNVVLV